METNGENSEEASYMSPAEEPGEKSTLSSPNKVQPDSSFESQSSEPACISDKNNGFSANDSAEINTSEDLSIVPIDSPQLTPTESKVESEPKNDDNVKPGEETKDVTDLPEAAHPTQRQVSDKQSKEKVSPTTSSTTASNNQNDKTTAPTTDTAKSSKSGRRTRSIRSELDRLLMDEGTVKILMGRSSRSGGSSASTGDVTKEEKMSELQKNRDLAIAQVREGSTTLFRKVSLRQKSKYRKQQEQQKESKNKKIKLESSSRIIRRRSSSSNFSRNFSSRSPSPLHPNVTAYSSEDDPVQVRVQDNIGYITISATLFTFNSQTLSRLTSILNSMKLDDTVTLVQLTTTTNDFIQGLDIECIRSETDDSLRESMADSMIACLDTLLKALMNYPKILVAGVAGEAVDFGVLVLTFFDLVFASDKATFQTNYAKHGYLPECLQFFPRNRLTNAMLYTGKKLTATEGLTSGLVTESLWPAKFQAELANRIRTLSSSNQQILLRTKTELIQKKNSSKLELTRDLRASWLNLI